MRRGGCVGCGGNNIPEMPGIAEVVVNTPLRSNKCRGMRRLLGSGLGGDHILWEIPGTEVRCEQKIIFIIMSVIM